MRYNSSKAAVSSGSYGGGSSSRSYGGGSSSRSYGGGSSSRSYGNSSSRGGGGVVLKKDGTPDMRYASSRAAGGRAPSSTSSGGGGVVLKKDGTPDMRYASSRAAVGRAPSSTSSGGGGVVLKKDGTPDMRYASSRAAVGRAPSSTSSGGGGVVLKKDGTPDMRYASSRAAASGSGTTNQSSLMYKKDGTLDMRFKSSREHVARNRGQSHSAAADGLHYKKDGTLDMRFATSKHAAAIDSAGPPRELRRAYYDELCQDQDFLKMACAARDHWDCDLPPSEDVVLPAQDPQLSTFTPSASSIAQSVGVHVAKFEYSNLGIEEKNELGSGAFGTVFAGTLPSSGGIKVAVKRLHIGNVGRKKSAMRDFLNELKVMSKLGTHRNIIGLKGYCEKPLAIVLEFAEIGSLHHVLHDETDKTVESNMLVGKLKLKIAFEIADGLRAMHSLKVVHRDVKPHNGTCTTSSVELDYANKQLTPIHALSFYV